MKRSEHEAIVLEHISALGWADHAKTRRFVQRLAGYFGIFDYPDIALAETARQDAEFRVEHRRFHAKTKPRKAQPR